MASHSPHKAHNFPGTAQLLIVPAILISVSISAFGGHWMSSTSWGTPAQNFPTNVAEVWTHIDASVGGCGTTGALCELRWIRPDGTRETSLGTNVVMQYKYNGGSLSGVYAKMVVQGMNRPQGVWAVEFRRDSIVTAPPGIQSVAHFTLGGSSPPPSGRPNLRPTSMSGWRFGPIIVSTQTGNTSDSSSIYPDDTIYVDICILNDGDTEATSTYSISLKLDGQELGPLGSIPHAPGNFIFAQDIPIGPLSAGQHTLVLNADSTGVISEINESDNSYSKSFTVKGGGPPDLEVYKPSSWSDAIVVSTMTGTNTDAAQISPQDTIYIDWAVGNGGDGSVDSAFSVRLNLDGQEFESWRVNPPLGSYVYTTRQDTEMGPLAPGTYTLELVADSLSEISESDETDNTYSRTFTVVGEGGDLPNLRPYKPSEWTDPVVVSSEPDTTTDSQEILDTDTIFIDFAVLNDSEVDVTDVHRVALSLDGKEIGSWTSNPPHKAGYYRMAADVEAGPLNAGTHTVRLDIDPDSEVDESNENDNVFTKQFTVTGSGVPAGDPNLRPYKPNGWSAPLVISTVRDTNTDSSPIEPTDTIYVDWAVLNDSEKDVSSAFSVVLRIDGQVAKTWERSSLDADFYTRQEDSVIGPLSAGSHTFELVADSGSDVTESDEADNSYSRTITVEGEEAEEILMIFPVVRDDPEAGTGIAVANPTSDPAQVKFFLVEDSGDFKTAALENPKTFDLPPNQQIAKTLTDLFGSDAKGFEGWVIATSENLGLVGFFLTFSNDVGRIDGAEATVIGLAGSTMVFPEVLTGNDSTRIHLIGSGNIELELYRGSTGLVEKQTVEITGMRYDATAEEIFSSTLTQDSCILARPKSDQQSYLLAGYEEFGGDSYIGGRNAIPVSETGRDLHQALFGAQLADTPAIESWITVVNPTNMAANLDFSAFSTGVSTSLPAAAKSLTLGAKSVIKVHARSFLGLPTGDFVGWLRLDSDVAGIIGDVTFGDSGGNFLSSVQLQEAPIREFVFSHIADGLGYFTGVTFLNVSADPANVTVEVYNVNGVRTGTGSFELAPFEHRPRVLSQIIEDLPAQIGGHIRVSSDIGIFSFELFGYSSKGKLASMAAVPPQRGHGTIRGELLAVEANFLATVGKRVVEQAQAYPESLAKGVFLEANADFVPGEVVVKLDPFHRAFDSSSLARAYDLHVVGSVPGGLSLLRNGERTAALSSGEPNHVPSFESKRGTFELIEALNSTPGVLFAEPNYIFRAQRIPNDTRYGQQWHYDSINLPEAWDLTTGSSNIIVAVADTGAKFSHPDLAGRLTGGQYDFVSDLVSSLDGNGIDPSAEDPGDDPAGLTSSFHGTHVAGTVGAATNNGRGVAGVNWQSPLMTLRVLGKGGAGTFYDLAQALLYAARLPNDSNTLPPRKANVINLSLSAESAPLGLQLVVAEVLAQNVVIVAAAGNQSSSKPRYPAAYPGVIAVGATDLTGGLSYYSNWGSHISIVAPGGDIRYDTNNDGNPDGVLSTLWSEGSNTANYQFYQGTSMASPHVAGIVSLMLSEDSSLTPAQVKQYLEQTATDLGTQGRDDRYGHGLVNPRAAILEAMGGSSEDPQLSLSTSTLDFGKTFDQLTVAVSNAGGGTLEVDTPTWTTNQGSGWLSAGFSGGTLTVSVDRGGLADGDYTGEVHLTSNGGNADVQVLMEVGEATDPDIGTVWVLALNPTTLQTIMQESTNSASGYLFEMPPVPVGVYFVVAGSDNDDDGFICDEGEYCGIYPVTGKPDLVHVKPNQVTEVSFVITSDESQSAGESGENATGYLLRTEERNRFQQADEITRALKERLIKQGGLALQKPAN